MAYELNPDEIQSLLDQLQQSNTEKPKASSTDYNLGTHIAAALGAIGSAMKAGAGVNPGNGASDIYGMADARRKAQDEKALSDWEDKRKDISKPN